MEQAPMWHNGAGNLRYSLAMTKFASIAVLVAMFCFHARAAAGAAGDFTLVINGQPAGVIVLPRDATAAERRAGDELQTFLKQMSGAKLPIVRDDQPIPPNAIVLGGKNVGSLPASLGNEGFILRTTGEHILVAGPGPRGTLYGATTFLEKLGVRWFTPTITRVPKHATITVPPLDETQVPSFEYREPYMAEARDKDWSARLKTNGTFANLDESTGGHMTYGAFCHTLDSLVPQDLFATHPEYFPLIGGKRTNGYVQRCLSNPDVLKMSIERVRKWMHDQPNATIFSVSQNDCIQFCECDQCKAIEAQYGGEHSSLYVWFVNQVAEAVEKEFPDKLIDTLAYQFTEAPPAKIKPRANVRIRLCPIGVCEAHPSEQCAFKASEALVKRLEKWSQISDSLYIWHYCTNFHHYLAPFPDFRQFPESLRLYHRRGVKGVFFQGSYSSTGGSDAEMRAYVMAKLLWDVNAEADALVTEWMQGVYGVAAAKPMRQWFDLVHDKAAAAQDKHLFVHGDSPLQYMTPDVLAEGNRLFDEAEKQIGTDDLAKRQLAKARLWLRYAQIVNTRSTGPELTQFVADMKAHGISCTGEPWDLKQWEGEFRAKAK